MGFEKMEPLAQLLWLWSQRCLRQLALSLFKLLIQAFYPCFHTAGGRPHSYPLWIQPTFASGFLPLSTSMSVLFMSARLPHKKQEHF